MLKAVPGIHGRARRAALCLLAACALSALGQQPAPRYKDATLPVDERVADLLSRMTLAEKVAQLGSVWAQKPKIQDEQGRFDPAKAGALLANGIGEISRPSEIGPGGRRIRGP